MTSCGLSPVPHLCAFCSQGWNSAEPPPSGTGQALSVSRNGKPTDIGLPTSSVDPPAWNLVLARESSKPGRTSRQQVKSPRHAAGLPRLSWRFRDSANEHGPDQVLT